MKVVITLFVLMITIFADDNSDIGFQYGFLSKPSYESNDITVLSDSSVIRTGDWLRINIGYQNKTNFCIVYRDADGGYMKLYSSDEEKESNQEIVYAYPLTWSDMEEPAGIETFYFINTSESLSDLFSMLGRYDKAPPKGKSKLAARIQDKIDVLDPNVQDDLSSIASRLDKPVTGGVAFRGEEEEGKIKDLSVTHECLGTGGTAFQKIVLIHK